MLGYKTVPRGVVSLQKGCLGMVSSAEQLCSRTSISAMFGFTWIYCPRHIKGEKGTVPGGLAALGLLRDNLLHKEFSGGFVI